MQVYTTNGYFRNLSFLLNYSIVAKITKDKLRKLSELLSNIMKHSIRVQEIDRQIDEVIEEKLKAFRRIAG